MAAAGQGERIDDPVRIERRKADPGELFVEEARIKARIVRNQPGIADKGEPVVDDLGKARLVDQHVV